MALKLKCVVRNAFLKTSINKSMTVATLSSYPVVIVGGGSGGCTMAAKLARKLGSKDSVAVIEPSDVHYYQPLWTLVGAGLVSLERSAKPMKSCLPKKAAWIQDSVTSLDPMSNTITLQSGQTIGYSYLILATGLKNDFESIKGLPEALQSVPGVCSNYSPVYVNKTRDAIQNFPTSGGNALFTFPNTPIKCPGAPQKIAYLAEAAFRRAGIRDKVNITFNSSLGVIFGVKKYADALWKYVVNERDINVNFKHNLVEVKPESKEAVFELLDEPGKYATFPFDMLHVVPPMTTPQFLKDAKDLTNAAGFVNVNQENLQHVKYSNIFALGDCSSLPTSKTAAAIASQAGVLLQTMDAVMKGKKPTEIYDGYTSCPLVTGNGKCILAEFDYQVQPLETFPINQGKERMTMFQLKKDVMPFIYWNLMLKGFWNGPKTFRKILHLGMSK